MGRTQVYRLFYGCCIGAAAVMGVNGLCVCVCVCVCQLLRADKTKLENQMQMMQPDITT